MKDIAIIKSSKGFFKKIIYSIRYSSKFRNLNIDKSFSDCLIKRCDGLSEQEIFSLIRSSKTPDDFEQNIHKYFSKNKNNIYANTLLIGNVTGRYVFYNFYYNSVKNLNIEAFSKNNNQLLLDLKSHFFDYVVSNNNYKNVFAEMIKAGKTSIRDLSQDINKENVITDFEQVLNGNQLNNTSDKSQIISDYLMRIIGTYSKEDITNNFDFILYDMNNNQSDTLDNRRQKYLLHKNLSNSQLKKLGDVYILKNRLKNINTNESNTLLSRLESIENSLSNNIDELEDIYRDYEALYRQDLVNHLYMPTKDVTIITNYQDIKPQLIHKFIRNPQKFMEMEISKAKEKIISERRNKNTSNELTLDEQKRLDNMISQINANLNQYRVNYSTDGQGTMYSDSIGFDYYHSDTSNQISASIFKGNEFIHTSHCGIIVIGFTSETLNPEAIAISSNSYKTTNKGLNNLEYNEEDEFREMSSPFPELIKSNGNSEVVMHRRGLDFDTKASYIFATIDSSNQKQTNEIISKLKQIMKEENLKVVIYDIYKIRQSLYLSKEKNNLEKSR